MNWYKFKAGKHHLAKEQTTMFGYGMTVCGLPIDEHAEKVSNDVTVWPVQQLTNLCKRCLKRA